MRAAGLKRGVVIVENPQTGEILAMVSLPDLRRQRLRPGDQQQGLREAPRGPEQAAPEPRGPGPLPARVHVQARDGHRRADRPQDLADDAGRRRGRTCSSARRSSGSGTTAAGGRSRSTSGFAHSSDTFFFQLAGMLGIDRLAHWAHEYGFGQPTGIDLPGEVSGIVPSNAWKQATFGEDDLPRRGPTRPGSGRAMTSSRRSS